MVSKSIHAGISDKQGAKRWIIDYRQAGRRPAPFRGRDECRASCQRTDIYIH